MVEHHDRFANGLHDMLRTQRRRTVVVFGPLTPRRLAFGEKDHATEQYPLRDQRSDTQHTRVIKRPRCAGGARLQQANLFLGDRIGDLAKAEHFLRLVETLQRLVLIEFRQLLHAGIEQAHAAFGNCLEFTYPDLLRRVVDGEGGKLIQQRLDLTAREPIVRHRTSSPVCR